MQSGRVFCVVFGTIFCALVQAQDSRTVVIEQGPVRGYKNPGGHYVFYNIPYATAPTGKDRFKAPLPAPVWVTPREAIDRGVVCPQFKQEIAGWDSLEGKTIQEDCLIANVYVPDTDTQNLPVVVLVHGGGYLTGYGNAITFVNMVQTKKVIYVNFNYRLGIHGFLCLGTPDVPGNAGMKDMLALLRWVKRNIASFGGNPDDITLDGYSAGSSAVDLLLLSNDTKGLFNKAIPESGANVAGWSVQIDPIATAKEFAKSELGFENVDDFFALEEFYKTLPYDVIHDVDSIKVLTKYVNQFVFVPCVERDTGAEEMFLDDSPVNILKKGDYNKVPLLSGFANMEGLFRVGSGFEQYSAGMNKKFSDYLPLDLQFKDETEKEQVANKVKEFYFGNKTINNDTIFEFIDYYTDVMFAYPQLRSLQLQVEAGNNKIYLYQFSHPYENPAPAGVNVQILGSGHCAQTMIVADASPLGPDAEDEEVTLAQLKNVTRQFWSNFITTGEPVPAGSDLPAWPVADKLGSPYMDITEHPQLLLEGLLSERARFWDGIYESYYLAPSPPPAPPAPSSSSRIVPALGIVASAILLWFM
ncbi:carboxylesterase family domain-containing protein [Phthorimaea operculella]|nr:carboxylesterase family domain-containing protein [Phthorimaea operculella]